MAKNFEERWVTINGSPVLIGDDGEVKGGAGGALRGKPMNPKSKSESRRHLNLLRERLSAGGLKRGERKLIEKRIEGLSKKILESGDKEMADIKVKDFVIFKVGNWNGESYTEADLDNMVANFNSDEGIPIIVGHSSDYKGKTRIPAFGRILGGLKRVGTDLIARGVEMNDKLAAWIREGFYNQRSIELTRDNKRVLAVGMLGAIPPAVKGLPANDEMLDEVALQFSEMKDAKVIEFAEDIDLDKIQEAGTEDTMKNVDECFAMCSKDIEMALTSDQDPEKCKEECMSAMAMCMQDVSDEINRHTSFTEKIQGMKPDMEEDEMPDMKKMMAKLKEWLGIKSTNTKESDVDAKKEQEYKDAIAAQAAKVVELEARVKEFSDKAEAEAQAKMKAEQEKKDAEAKAADEALKTEIKVFCDKAVEENRMTPAMREKDEPIMYNLGKSSPEALKSFQEKYVAKVVPEGEVDLNKLPVIPDSYQDKAKKYVEAHGKDKEFSDCTTLEAKIARAVHLEKMRKIKFV